VAVGADEAVVKICIVNHAPPSANPRARKEADSLSAAGHDVTVVSASHVPATEAECVRSIDSRWRYRTVNYRRDTAGGFARLGVSRARQAVSRIVARRWRGCGLAERALMRVREGFIPVLVSEAADLYLAHNLPGLPVAAHAARRCGALLGFDIEDYHLDEEGLASRDALAPALKAYVMAKYLPQCDYLSTTSEAMADAIANALGVRRPVVLYNAFPLREAADVLPPIMRSRGRGRGAGYTAYWFSQVVGLDRGLQDFIKALPRLHVRVDLHCRGRINETTREEVLRLAEAVGVASQIHLCPPLPHTRLVADASRFDFGLALEQPVNQAKQLTASNKLFVYLLSGLVPVVTDVTGQREVMNAVGECGVIFRPGDVDGLVRGMNGLLTHPSRIVAAQQAAWDAARRRFCWDIEEKTLRAAVETLRR
jgi:glycosyltransferase involved in cell wall biosynthesis